MIENQKLSLCEKCHGNAIETVVLIRTDKGSERKTKAICTECPAIISNQFAKKIEPKKTTFTKQVK